MFHNVILAYAPKRLSFRYEDLGSLLVVIIVGGGGGLRRGGSWDNTHLLHPRRKFVLIYDDVFLPQTVIKAIMYVFC